MNFFEWAMNTNVESETTEVLSLSKTRYTKKFGNGTTSLFIALRAVGCRDRYVAVPAAVCPNVIAAVLSSGNLPWFVDIELERLGIGPSDLSCVIDQVGAVIAVHAYGAACHISDIKRICSDNSVPLIEDCAQAEGAIYNGTPVGNFGDVAIFSYGSGKIIDAGGGGCAVTSQEELMTKIEFECQNLPDTREPRAADELAFIYKFFYNNFYPDGLKNYRFIFSRLLRDFGLRILAVHDNALDGNIKEAQDNLTKNIAARRSKAELYSQLLRGKKNIEIWPIPDGAVPWRFNIWLRSEIRNPILKTMLNEGYNISSWFPDIREFFDDPGFRSTDLHNSQWLSRRIINLWLDDATDEIAIRSVCSRLLNLTGNM
jgi:dTDP-4-amino-4,6-dideoxygalactose transaminase